MTHALGIRCIDPRAGFRGWIPSYEILYTYIYIYIRLPIQSARDQTSPLPAKSGYSLCGDKGIKPCVIQQIPAATRICVVMINTNER